MLCPVARINNVAVYGVDGTFYTRIHQVVFNVAADPTNTVNDEDIRYEKWYRDNSNSTDATGLGTGEALVVDKFGNYLNSYDRWSGVNSYFNYNILSTQNISGLNTHLYTYDTVDVLSGGKIAIDGYVFYKNGINRYKYSLDGGDTWTVIYDEVSAGYSSSQLTNAHKYDTSFVADDIEGGEFCSSKENFATWSTWPSKTVTNIQKEATTDLRANKKAWLNEILTFALPSVPKGEKRNLLVVAESNDASGNPSGKLIPMLSVNVNFIYETNREFQFGTYRMVNNQVRPDVGDVKENSVYSLTPTVPGTSTVNNIRARVTIPISEAGNYTISAAIKMYKDENGGTLINDPRISCCIVQDSGEYTIFSSDAMPLSHSDPRVIATWVNPQTNGVAAQLKGQKISLTFTATQDDAERGYVVWDWDLTSLPLGVKYHWRLEGMTLTKNS